MTIYHKHHIVPKHAGGSNAPSNIVSLTIEEHSEAHRVLFETYGRWQDKIAWHVLSGQLGVHEARIEAVRNSRMGTHHTAESKRKMSVSRIGIPLSDKTKLAMSKAKTGNNNPNFGIPLSKEQKQIISETQKYKKVSCVFCRAVTNPGNLGRWHKHAELVDSTGIEPATSSLQSWRSPN